MPTIPMFYRILMRMFFHDTGKHHLPHIHAEYQGQVAAYAIEDRMLLPGNLLSGLLTSKGLGLACYDVKCKA